MASRYVKYSVPKLKAELASCGAAVSGRKTVLIERLEAYRRNSNFQQPAITSLPEPLAVEWPSTGFQQLNQQHKLILPKLTTEQIESYFLYRMADDRQSIGDIKALEKGQDMFVGDRVQACSMFIREYIFMTGIVGAAMKNKVSYNFKLKLDKLTGDPLNTHCECPAGKGPHGTCKHLAAVLLMLQHFIDTGEIRVEKSCTENLQTFHKPKSTHQGAPVAASDLPSKRKTGDDFLEDPRPMKFRNTEGYNDFVRNCIINHCAVTSQDIALRYLYGKANIQIAALDHDYTSLPFIESWVDSAVQVTQVQAIMIEEATRSQSSSKTWFRERAWRITASRFGEICKRTYRRNITKLCASLLTTCHSKMHSAGLRHGKIMKQKL